MNKLKLVVALTFGLFIADKKYTSVTLREADVGDMIDAESDVGPGTIVAFSTAMMARQIVEVSGPDGTYSGPITIDMLRKLKPKDYRKLRDAQEELEQMGNAEQSASAASSTESS
ncbi:MAG TPA: phage tail assembly protein [Fluviicoccus sp.]|nr:phage tail assembly protein [Fluviicoccus sp.]